MYINRIRITNFRTFRDATVDFVHPDQDFQKLEFPVPKLKNINLLLANNGLGKTTMLKAIALATLGPAVGKSGIQPFRLVRRDSGEGTEGRHQRSKRIAFNVEATINATFTPHIQDHVGSIRRIESLVKIIRDDDEEVLRWAHPDDKPWHPIFNEMTDAFFVVGYGSSRRVQSHGKVPPPISGSPAEQRAKRVQSLFEETYAFLPLISWLPTFKKKNPGRYAQVIALINKFMAMGEMSFSGEIQDYEYVFVRKGMKIPFQALSDGYRAFLGWVGDLLYHVCMTAPTGNKLTENKGIVMVDEIDLHLHPKWQMTMLGLLATELPNIQFIVTSHSPLVVGSLEWMNIIVMKTHDDYSTTPVRIDSAVNGLSADQILISDFFGLESTRAPGKQRKLRELTLQAYEGNLDAAAQILAELSTGAEETRQSMKTLEKHPIKIQIGPLVAGPETGVTFDLTDPTNSKKRNPWSGSRKHTPSVSPKLVDVGAVKKKSSAKKGTTVKRANGSKLR